MKRLFLLFAVLLSAAAMQAQSGVKKQVISAIGSGNARALSAGMVTNVDMALPSASGYYSKAQAEQILRKFFDEHKAQGFTVEHEGASRMGDSYCIGQLHTSGGNFRVTFFLKKVSNSFQVKQLRIEPGKATH